MHNLIIKKAFAPLPPPDFQTFLRLWAWRTCRMEAGLVVGTQMREFTSGEILFVCFKLQIVIHWNISGALAKKLKFSFLQKTQITFSTVAPEMICEIFF